MFTHNFEENALQPLAVTIMNEPHMPAWALPPHASMGIATTCQHGHCHNKIKRINCTWAFLSF